MMTSVKTDFGDWDGFTLEEIQQRWPAAAAAWRRDPRTGTAGRGELRRHRTPGEPGLRPAAAGSRRPRPSWWSVTLPPIKIMLCRALGVPLSTLYRLYLGSACINEIQVARPRICRRPSRQRHQPPSVTHRVRLVPS